MIELSDSRGMLLMQDLCLTSCAELVTYSDNGHITPTVAVVNTMQFDTEVTIPSLLYARVSSLIPKSPYPLSCMQGSAV